MRKQENKRRSMRDRIRERAAKPRISKFEYLNIPDGAEKFVVEGKTKVSGDKKILTKRLDVMPYVAGAGNPNCEKGDSWFERTYWVHKISLGDNNSITFVCPAKTRGEKCPACEMAETLRKDPKSTKLEIGAWLPKERQLFNVRDLSDPDKVKIFDVSYHLFGKLLDARINGQDDDDGFDLFAELKGGKTLRVQFEEKKWQGNRFFEAISIDFKDREEDYEDSAIEESVCLDDILVVHPYQELYRMLFESDTAVNSGEEDEDSEDDDDTPPKKSGKVAKKPVKDEDEDSEDEDEEETKPVKKSKPVAKKKDEEEDESEDEEEDEKPAKKSSKVSKPAKKSEPEDEDEDDESEGEDSEDEEEDEEPPKKSGKVAKKPVKDEDEDSEDEDEDSEEEEESDEDEDEEEEPPKKSSKGGKPSKKSEPEEDEDEDEEEKPAKKSKKKDEDEEDEDEEEPEDEDEEEKPAKKSGKDSKSSGKNPCPFGHKFGKDCDEDHCVSDCKDCDKWDECSDAQEKMRE